MNIIKTIQWNCYFEKMKKCIIKFIKQCNNCQKNKHLIHKKYGIMQIIPKLKKQWQLITMDFITKLLKFKNLITNVEYNSIWVIIDWYDNKFIYLPFWKNYNAKILHMIWVDWITKHNNYFEKIINDKKILFTSNYWKTMTKIFKTKLKYSTIFHLQMDD